MGRAHRRYRCRACGKKVWREAWLAGFFRHRSYCDATGRMVWLWRTF